MKKWEIYNTDDDLVKRVSKKYNISKVLATVIINRGILDDKEIRIFLEPTRSDFHNPYLMPDMEQAVDRIIEAIEKKEKVMIYGDYDVDGITSITVIYRFLKERGLIPGYYIPNRLSEGYGLNKNAIKKIYEEGFKLIITVDCGISAIEEIDYANKLGMEVIVTDHHEPLDLLPKAVGVIDCKRKDSNYPFNSLAGVGVAFKFIQAISQKMNLHEKEYLKYLDIVSIGTISDIVPMIDENRVIAKLGLKLAEVTKNIGLKALLLTSGYNQINSNTVAFGLAPRINACGRMGHEKEALSLFLSEDKDEVIKISQKLNSYNRERQEIEKRIFEEVIIEIKNKGLDKNNSIIVGKENWHHGVIGIVASKITDLFFKPCILICFEGELGKGSGRSVPGFDLHNALCKSSNYLEKYGGHEMAVGLSLKKEQFYDFIKNFEEITKQCHTEDIISIIKIDKEITIKDISKEFVDELKKIEPFGEANNQPIFIYKNLKIDSIRTLSEGKHLKLTLKDGNSIINAIGFNMGNLSNEYLLGTKVDVVGTLELNSYSGIDTIQINLKDIRKSY
ncbi:MAG: single-stranded-DNA-specific exonuclease RecJ [Clostridia bacterium]|nr:single-stranded-DNA-specific exonuclease RecJ [Clostridia bacterium]